MYSGVVVQRPPGRKGSTGKSGGSKPGKKMLRWDADENAAMAKIVMQMAFDHINPDAANNRDFKKIEEVTKKMRIFWRKRMPLFYEHMVEHYWYDKEKETRADAFARLKNAMSHRVHKAYYTNKDNTGKTLPKGDPRRLRKSPEHYINNSKLVELQPKAQIVYREFLEKFIRLVEQAPNQRKRRH
jgi:hypothetical protein